MVVAMKILRDVNALHEITQIECREFIRRRIDEICPNEVYVPTVHSLFAVVESGDEISTIEAAVGFTILTSFFDGIRYGQDGFTPCFEWVAEHPTCYEMPFVLSDDGYGVVIIIPKMSGIDAGLLKLCAEYAEPVLDCVPLATVSVLGL